MSDNEESPVVSPQKSVVEGAYNSACDWLTDVGHSLAGKTLGQFLFRKTDGILWTLEKAVQWSVREDEQDPHATSGSESPSTPVNGMSTFSISETPVRPLPWVFFIPLLLVIRLVRAGLGLVTLVTKGEPITPKHMVRYFQSVRRRLRVIKYRGIRAARRPATPPTTSTSTQTQTNGEPRTAVDLFKEKKRKFEEIAHSSADETTEDKLVRFVQEEENDEHDPDFEPDSSLDSDDTASSSDADEHDAEAAVDVDSEESTSMTEASKTITAAPSLVVDVQLPKVPDFVVSPVRSEMEIFLSAEVGSSNYASLQTSTSSKDSLSVIERSGGSQDSALRKLSNIFSNMKEKKSPTASIDEAE